MKSNTKTPSFSQDPFYALAVFGTLLVPGILTAGLVPQELSEIMKEYQLTEQTFMYLSASIAVIAVFLGLTAAKAVPRFGAYNVCLAGYLIFALGMAGVVLAPSGMIGAVFGVGIAWGMAYLHQGNGLVVQLSPQRAASMTNLLHGMNAFGKAMGPSFALIGIGWRHSFASLGGLALILGLMGWLGKRKPLPETESKILPTSNDKEKEKNNDEMRVHPAGEALRDKFFWACAIMFAPILGMELTVTLWLPKYLQQDAGYSLAEGKSIGVTAASIMLWVICAGRFAAPVLLRSIPAIGYLLVSLMGAAGLYLGTEYGWWSGSGGALTMVLFGLACSSGWPTFFAIVSRYFPHHIWLFSIVSGAATTVAWILFGTLGGIIGTKYGLLWTLRMAPVLGLVVMGGVLAVYVKGERRLKGQR